MAQYSEGLIHENIPVELHRRRIVVCPRHRLRCPHKYRVHDPVTVASLLARGGKIIADYGSFQLIELDAPTLTSMARDVELEDESDVIELHAARINTREAAVKAQRRALAGFPGKRLHLVQFAGPVKPEWIEDLEKSGARIVSYIPNNAYLVYGDAPGFTKMQNWAGTNALVQWEGDYADDYKINPRARLTNELGQAQTPVTDWFAIQLVADDAANTNTLALIDQLKLAPIQNQFRTLDYLNVIVRLPAARLNEIAARPEVVSIQPYLDRRKFCERQAQIMAGNLSGNVPSGPGYLAWLASKGFTQAQFDASGFVVDVSDSGIDDGTTTPNHFGLFKTGNIASTSRVAYARLEGSANSGSTLQGCDGHGNLNGHIIAGYDDLAGFPFADASGYHYGLGICPFVKIGSSVVFDPANFTSPNYANLQSRAYRDGARVSNNSWGADTAGAYDGGRANLRRTRARCAARRFGGAQFGQSRNGHCLRGGQRRPRCRPRSARRARPRMSSRWGPLKTCRPLAARMPAAFPTTAPITPMTSFIFPAAVPALMAASSRTFAHREPTSAAAWRSPRRPRDRHSQCLLQRRRREWWRGFDFFPVGGTTILHGQFRHKPLDAGHRRGMRFVAAILYQSKPHAAQPGHDQILSDEFRALPDRR